MKADSRKTFFLSFINHSDYFFQSHLGAVIKGTPFFRIVQELLVHKGTGINDDICILDMLFSSKGNKVWSTASGTDKVYHSSFSFAIVTR